MKDMKPIGPTPCLILAETDRDDRDIEENNLL